MSQFLAWTVICDVEHTDQSRESVVLLVSAADKSRATKLARRLARNQFEVKVKGSQTYPATTGQAVYVRQFGRRTVR